MRIGHGYDIHKIKSGGTLMLAGVKVSDEMSAIAHSDGDVVIHAIVDAMLGTGATGAPTGVIAEAVTAINRRSSVARVIAVDNPTGVDASTGEVAGDAVFADLTISLHAPKVGQYVAPGVLHCGEVRVADIGIPAGIIESLDGPHLHLLTRSEMRELIGPRAAEAVARAVRDDLLFRAEVCAVPAGSLPRFEMKAKRVVWQGTSDK